MSYIDIAIIVLVSIGALLGLKRGFFKTIISFFGWLVSFVIAFFLTKFVAEKLLGIEAIKSIVLGESGSIFSWVSGILPADIASGTGVWGVILKPILSIAQSGGANEAASVALLLTNGIYNVIVCIALFIAIRIVMLIFTKIANVLTSNRVIGALNRFLGFIVGAIKGAGFVCILLVITSFFTGFSFMSGVRAELDKSVIGKPLSTFVFNFTDRMIKADGDLLDRLLEAAGIPKNEVPPETEGDGNEDEKEQTPVAAKDDSQSGVLQNPSYGNFGNVLRFSLRNSGAMLTFAA